MKCRNCGRVLIQSADATWRNHKLVPSRRWVHRAEDFDPDKPIDCYAPAPDVDFYPKEPLRAEVELRDVRWIGTEANGTAVYGGYLPDGRPVLLFVKQGVASR